MVICFEDQETGRCLRESPTDDRSYTTKMYSVVLVQVTLYGDYAFKSFASFHFYFLFVCGKVAYTTFARKCSNFFMVTYIIFFFLISTYIKLLSSISKVIFLNYCTCLNCLTNP